MEKLILLRTFSRPCGRRDVARAAVHLCDGHMDVSKTVQLIEMPFKGLTRVGPRNHVLEGVEKPPPPMEGGLQGVVRPMDKHWEFLLRCTQQKG